MGAAAGPAGFGLSLASVGFQAASELNKGKANAASAEFQAERKKRAAEYGRIQADQTDAALREELNTTLSNIDAIRTAANTDLTSPTALALKAREDEISDRERRTRVFNIRAQANEDEMASAYLRRSARDTLLASRIGAAAAVTKGLAGAIPR